MTDYPNFTTDLLKGYEERTLARFYSCVVSSWYTWSDSMESGD